MLRITSLFSQAPSRGMASVAVNGVFKRAIEAVNTKVSTAKTGQDKANALNHRNQLVALQSRFSGVPKPEDYVKAATLLGDGVITKGEYRTLFDAIRSDNVLPDLAAILKKSVDAYTIATQAMKYTRMAKIN